ncbi:MAG: site-specific integrase, partial [Planctomycetales bacterium]|nr:site-specific integrase [Planctomycetales bacterium]
MDDYISRRTDVKEATRTIYGMTRRCLVGFFGANKQMGDVTAGDADDFRRYLADKESLSENTIRRRCGIAKQFFNAALRKKLIAENPFAEMKRLSVGSNDARVCYISRETAAKVLDACPDAEWRLIFALSRYGGLRCPSEHMALRLSDVEWEHNRIRVSSPKTAHHDGKDHRMVPIFPELRPYLDAVWHNADDGDGYLITRHRGTNVNLRTQFGRILSKAGVEAWPKLFHNLRATRETELAAVHPLHVVCEWIGNSSLIAQEHYLRVTDADFDRATGALQNAMQQPPGMVGNALQAEPDSEDRIPVLQGIAESRNPLLCNEMGVEGLEPPT